MSESNVGRRVRVKYEVDGVIDFYNDESYGDDGRIGTYDVRGDDGSVLQYINKDSIDFEPLELKPGMVIAPASNPSKEAAVIVIRQNMYARDVWYVADYENPYSVRAKSVSAEEGLRNYVELEL